MSMINFLRHHPLKLFIYRQQSQKIFDLLNRKTPIEIESNDELENLPCENTIEWNKKLKAYRIRGEGKKALKFFEIGLRKHRFQPDYITYISMLELCKEIKDVDNGRYIHRHILNTEIRDNTRIQGLIMEMYIKGGDLESAREMFDTLKHRTVVEYNALMTAYNMNQYPERTIELFNSMREPNKIKPNNISNMLYFQACIMLKLFEQGKVLHEEIKQKSRNYLKNKELANQIIAMYIASGDGLIAEELFNQVKETSIQNYVGLMNYFNQSKNWQHTLELYDRMKLQRKIQADLPTYLAVLTAIKEGNYRDKVKEIQEDLLKQNLWQNHIEIQNLLKEISKYNDQRYFQSYDQFQVHELMLRDRPRVTAYHDAIMNNKHLFENKVVLDVGSGTGILSMFAAKAGAKLVYAVDACPTICDLAEELIKCNRLHDRIRVMNKRVEEIENFDENIDIIISEWMGFYLFHESMLESVIYARDHFLRTSEQEQSMTIFPSHAYLYCAPFFDQHLRVEANTMWTNYFDLNLSPLLPHIKNSDLSECVIETIEPSQLVHDAQLIQSIDLRTVQIEDLQSMHSFCQFDIDNTCIISGFCFWFDCYFSSTDSSSSVRLTTSPSSPATHWKQTLVFLPEDIYPLKGDTVPVDIRLKQSSENQRHYNLTIAIQENQSMDITSESSEEESEDEPEEHPIPCSCDRNKCKLIRMIIEKYDEENVAE